MKLSSTIVSFALGAVLCAGAQAQTTPAAAAVPKIGLVNIQYAIVNCDQGKAKFAQLKARFTPRSNQLKAENAQLQALQKKLQDGGDTLSALAKQQLTSRIARGERRLQRRAREAQNDFQSAQTVIINSIGRKMSALLNQYAKLHGYTFIFDHSLPWPRNPILYAAPGVSLTKQIIAEYNEKYPVKAAAAATPAQP